jgi:hypothetical protein
MALSMRSRSPGPVTSSTKVGSRYSSVMTMASAMVAAPAERARDSTE